MVTCNLGSIATDAFIQVNIEVIPNTTGAIVNIAQITGNEFDPVSSNNISTQTTTVTFRASDGSSGTNCSSSLVGAPKVSDTAFNLRLLMLPLLIIGARAVRRRK